MGAICKFTLIKKQFISTYVYVKSFYYTVFIFHLKCVSCLKSDISKTDLPCLELFEKKKKKKKRMNPMGFQSRHVGEKKPIVLIC